MSDVFGVFRVIQGPSFTGSILLRVVDSEQGAKNAVSDMDLQVKKLLSADLVFSRGNGQAEMVGMKAGKFLSMLGIVGVGHSQAKHSVESDIIVPQQRILMPS